MEKITVDGMASKLFCTFTPMEALDELVLKIRRAYDTLNRRIFVLGLDDSEELLCTYTVDSVNIQGLLPNTILTHRKKESRTIYTINSLNRLIQELNGGKFDKDYKVDWTQYTNSILLTQGEQLRITKTSLYQVFQD